MNYKDRATHIVEACISDRDLSLKLLVRIAAHNPHAIVRAHEGPVTSPSSLKAEEVFTPLQQRCVALIRKDRPIDAMKLYRNKEQCSIYEAKREIDRLKQVINIE